MLAKIAFGEGRAEELNAIIHPAVIARQAELSKSIFQRDPGAVVIVESALIFETNYSDTNSADSAAANSQPKDAARWHTRFDKIVLVTAPEELKIARYVARAAAGIPITEDRRRELEDEARLRLARQISDEQKSALSDYVLTNDGALLELEWQVDQLWPMLKTASEANLPRSVDR
jgi:dephospho-CoA kinase